MLANWKHTPSDVWRTFLQASMFSKRLIGLAVGKVRIGEYTFQMNSRLASCIIHPTLLSTGQLYQAAQKIYLLTIHLIDEVEKMALTSLLD